MHKVAYTMHFYTFLCGILLYLSLSNNLLETILKTRLVHIDHSTIREIIVSRSFKAYFLLLSGVFPLYWLFTFCRFFVYFYLYPPGGLDLLPAPGGICRRQRDSHSAGLSLSEVFQRPAAGSLKENPQRQRDSRDSLRLSAGVS